MANRTKTRPLYFVVVDRATSEVVETIDVTGKSEHLVEKALSGLLRNMDTDRFYVVDDASYAPKIGSRWSESYGGRS